VYFAHPLFALYHQYAPHWAKTLLGAALDLLLPEPLVRAGGPSSALFALNRQSAEGRLVLHALHYVPERRAERLDIIEDIIPIHDVPVSVRAEGAVKAVNSCRSARRCRSRWRARATIPKIEDTRWSASGVGDRESGGARLWQARRVC
jgi:hypothetical protein